MTDQNGLQIGKEAVGMRVVSDEQTTNVTVEMHETESPETKKELTASSGEETNEILANNLATRNDGEENKDDMETIQTRSQNSIGMEKSKVMHTLGLSVTGMVVATMVSVFAIYAMKRRRQRILNSMRLHDKLEDGNTNPGEANKSSYLTYCII